MADDLGWGDTGYNGNPVIKTPNLDQMAAEGIQFNRFYSAAPVCSPTRASCLTGRHPYRTGVFFANTGILRPEEITIAEVLNQKGYTCGHFGKWHLGTFTTNEKDANRGGPDQPEFLNPPTEHGFETYFSTESKVPTWDPMLKPVKFEKPESAGFGWNYLKSDEPSLPYGTHYWSPDGMVTENLRGNDSRVIMDRAIPFIEEAVKSDRPFLAVIWFHAPHLPCVAGPEYAAMYKDQHFKLQQYAGSVTAMDDQIGRLRTSLKQLGIGDNTMIWFCSDNGPEGKDTAPGRTGGFRGRKRSLFEGGVRVPGTVVWPKVVKHAEVNTPVVTSDLMPTIIEAAGAEAGQDDRMMDGESILPVLKGEVWERKEPVGFASSNHFSYNGRQYKMVDGNQLYDILDDPFEQNDIAKDHPDILERYNNDFTNWYESCRQSFEGKEYGTTSLKRVSQNYPEMNLRE